MYCVPWWANKDCIIVYPGFLKIVTLGSKSISKHCSRKDGKRSYCDVDVDDLI